ncbi:MAG: TolC family protein [Gammaproteobacteria bacterium]
MRCASVALFCAMLCCGVVRAETIDLDQAVARALNHDPRIEEVNHLVDAARALVDEAQGHKGWSIDLNSFLGVSPAVNGNIFKGGTCSPGSCELRKDRYDLNGLSLWGHLTVTVVKPLYTFGKVENYTKAAEANVEVKQGDVRLKRGQTVLDVKRAYYGYLAARDGRLLLEDVKKRVDSTIELVQRWLNDQTGNVRQSDLYALQSGSALIWRRWNSRPWPSAPR